MISEAAAGAPANAGQRACATVPRSPAKSTPAAARRAGAPPAVVRRTASLGQAMRFGVKPKVMLFDQPTSALDPEMLQEVLDVMTTRAKEA